MLRVTDHEGRSGNRCNPHQRWYSARTSNNGLGKKETASGGTEAVSCSNVALGLGVWVSLASGGVESEG